MTEVEYRLTLCYAYSLFFATLVLRRFSLLCCFAVLLFAVLVLCCTAHFAWFAVLLISRFTGSLHCYFVAATTFCLTVRSCGGRGVRGAQNLAEDSGPPAAVSGTVPRPAEASRMTTYDKRCAFVCASVARAVVITCWYELIAYVVAFVENEVSYECSSRIQRLLPALRAFAAMAAVTLSMVTIANKELLLQHHHHHESKNKYQIPTSINSTFFLLSHRLPLRTAEDVEGSWQLVFSTQLKKGDMPIRELVGFYPSQEEATIDATAGPLPIRG